jgi:hypothetical protein
MVRKGVHIINATKAVSDFLAAFIFLFLPSISFT